MSDKLFGKASSPEKLGISSKSVLHLLDRLANKRLTMHSMLLIRNGEVAIEANWRPFNADQLHRMYSVSKSFVSLAIGALIGEGKLALDTQAYTFFPDVVPRDLHPYLEQATVRDLLMMSTPNTDQSYTVHDKNWVWTFFNAQPSHPAGTIFKYDTAATVVLGTIVERLTGKTFVEYLRPILLDPIGFSRNAACVKTPEGSAWGGSGLQCTLRDMAKTAYVCLNHGRWGDKQLLPEWYVNEATSKQIDNSMDGDAGYGYQIWRLPQNGFAFFGMGSQYAYCFPDKGFIFACVSDTQCDPPGKSAEIQDAALELMSSLAEREIGEVAADAEALKARLSGLELMPLLGDADTPNLEKYNGAWYRMEENPMGISRMRVVINGDEGVFEYENARGSKRIEFGMLRYVEGEFPEYYFDNQIGVIGERRYRCYATAAWTEPHKLYLRVDVADKYFGGLQITISYKGEQQVGVYMTKIAEWFMDDYQGLMGGTRC